MLYLIAEMKKNFLNCTFYVIGNRTFHRFAHRLTGICSIPFFYYEIIEKPCRRDTESTEKEHRKIIPVGVFSVSSLSHSVNSVANDFFNSIIMALG